MNFRSNRHLKSFGFIRVAAFTLFFVVLSSFLLAPDTFAVHNESVSLSSLLERAIGSAVQRCKTPCGRAAAREVPIFAFHHISNEEGSILTEKDFRNYMQVLVDNGYEAVLYKDLVDYVNGVSCLPAKPIIIAFDDGYESNYIYAYPILKELGLKAEISIIGYTVGLGHYPDTGEKITKHFTWKEGLEMMRSGVINIHSHTYNLHDHEDSGLKIRRNGVDRIQGESFEEYRRIFRADLESACNQIEKNLNIKNIAYTYPYGIYNRHTEEILIEKGIPVSAINIPGINIVEFGKPESLRILKRIPCDGVGLDIIERIESLRKNTEYKINFNF